MSELEATFYQTRRLVAALIGSSDPPPGVLRPFVGGVVLSAALVGAEIARGLW